MELYAPTIVRFGSQVNVNRDVVRVEKKRFLTTLTNVRRFEIHGLRVQEEPKTRLASAVFRADWEAGVPAGSARSGHYRLTFRRIDDSWRIQSEEQL